jgi:hypothetical protein
MKSGAAQASCQSIMPDIFVDEDLVWMEIVMPKSGIEDVLFRRQNMS